MRFSIRCLLAVTFYVAVNCALWRAWWTYTIEHPMWKQDPTCEWFFMGCFYATGLPIVLTIAWLQTTGRYFVKR